MTQIKHQHKDSKHIIKQTLYDHMTQSKQHCKTCSIHIAKEDLINSLTNLLTYLLTNLLTN
jgi:hypothetical protein